MKPLRAVVPFIVGGTLIGALLRVPGQGAVIGTLLGLAVAPQCPTLYQGHVVKQIADGSVLLPEYRRRFTTWSKAKEWLDQHVAAAREPDSPAPAPAPAPASAPTTTAAATLAGFGFAGGEVPEQIRSAWDARVVAGAAWIMEGRATGVYASPSTVAASDRLPWNRLTRVPDILASVRANLRTERARNYITSMARQYWIDVEKGQAQDSERKSALPRAPHFTAKNTTPAPAPAPAPAPSPAKAGKAVAELVSAVAQGFNTRRAAGGAQKAAQTPDAMPATSTTSPDPAPTGESDLPGWLLPVGGLGVATVVIGLAVHFGRQGQQGRQGRAAA